MTTEKEALEALREREARKAFEAWAEGYMLEAGVTRDYASPAVQRMWDAWMGASSLAAADKRVADAVRGAQLGFQCLNSGRTIVVEQHDKVASHGFRNVLILPADAVGGG